MFKVMQIRINKIVGDTYVYVTICKQNDNQDKKVYNQYKRIQYINDVRYRYFASNANV